MCWYIFYRPTPPTHLWFARWAGAALMWLNAPRTMHAGVGLALAWCQGDAEHRWPYTRQKKIISTNVHPCYCSPFLVSGLPSGGVSPAIQYPRINRPTQWPPEALPVNLCSRMVRSFQEIENIDRSQYPTGDVYTQLVFPGMNQKVLRQLQVWLSVYLFQELKIGGEFLPGENVWAQVLLPFQDRAMLVLPFS